MGDRTTAASPPRAVSAPPDDHPLGLSAIVVVGELRERADRCLRALLSQGALGQMEVVLVDLASEAGAIPAAGHPAVRVLKMSPQTTFALARAAAVRTARGAIVAFVEEHVRVRPGWAAALIAAHKGPWAGVGGEVHNANPGVGRSDVTALLSYGLFRPPLAPGETDMLPGHNSAYKRAVLLALGHRLERLLGCDLVLMRRLQLDGHRLWIEPAAAIEHLNETAWRSAWRGYFLFNRCYAPLRAEELGWSLARRAAYVALTPAIPLYFIAHFSRYLARRHPSELPRLLRNLGWVYLAELAAALGQAYGLLFGEGDAPQRFSRYEMTEPRGVRAGRRAR
jgi:GT2 family glycosyltransferase